VNAIERGQRFLISRLEDNQRKNKQDNWEVAAAPIAGDTGFRGQRWGELTGLALLAQLSGPTGSTGDVDSACAWVMDAKINGTRATALRLRLCKFHRAFTGRDFRDSELKRTRFAATFTDLLLRQ
jgi:hypothetical protein